MWHLFEARKQTAVTPFGVTAVMVLDTEVLIR
jgi:hypothetical protein